MTSRDRSRCDTRVGCMPHQWPERPAHCRFSRQHRRIAVMTKAQANSHYLHGTAPDEQERLSRLNDLFYERSLREMALRPGEKVLDVGSGLGQLTRGMARQVGGGGVVGVERSEAQLAEAHRVASQAGADGGVHVAHGGA